ncbi:WD40-repeat-containing domain protein [Dipodascopsis uninucleata]
MSTQSYAGSREIPVTVARFSLAPTTKTTVVSTTTTTTTTTTFPPLVIQDPRIRRNRLRRGNENATVNGIDDGVYSDPRMYPLADQPTPSILKSFSFEIGGKKSHFTECENSKQSLAELNRMVQGGPNTAQGGSRDPGRRTIMTSTTTTTTKSENPASNAQSNVDIRSLKRPATPLASTRSHISQELIASNADDTKVVMVNDNKRRLTLKGKSSNLPLAPSAGDAATPAVEESGQDISSEESAIAFKHGLSTPLPGVSRTASSELDPESSETTDSDHIFRPKALTVDIEAAQTAQQVDPLSLPSPSLSPITGTLRNSNTDDYFSAQDSISNEDLDQVFEQTQTVMMQIPAMIETFDSFPHNVRNYVMYQLLKRCSKKTLSVVAGAVIPALRCDFLTLLPLELAMNILKYLDIRSLCIAAQVCRTWRDIIDGSEYTWRKLLERDGFDLEEGELERATRENWSMEGWSKLSSSDFSGPSAPATPSTSSEESSSAQNKRKRISKKFAKAVKAVNVPGDRQFHVDATRCKNIYKAIYRRHYLINENWMSPDSRPRHLSFPAHGRNVVTCLQFDSEKIITGSEDLCINVYDTRTGELRCRLDGHEGGVWALQYEGNTLVSGATDRTVRVWDIEKGICTHIFYGHTSTVRCLQILMPVRTGTTADGKPIMEPKVPLIVTGSRDSTLRVWRLPDLKKDPNYLPTSVPDDDGPFFLRALQGHQHSVRAISGYGDLLVSGSYDTFVRVWKISTGECLFRLAGHGAKVYSVVIDPKRGHCVSGSMDWLVKVWSLETGACLYTLEGHTSLVGLLDLNRTSLVSAAADSTLRVWNPETGAFIHKLEGHTGAITCFQHDEYKVISGSDGTLKLWNIKTGKVVKDLLSDLNRVWQVRFDDRRCVAAVHRGNETFIEVLDFDYDPTAPVADDKVSSDVESDNNDNRNNGSSSRIEVVAN